MFCPVVLLLPGRLRRTVGFIMGWKHEKDNAEQPQDVCGRCKEAERWGTGDGTEGPEDEGSEGRNGLLQSSDQMRLKGSD